MTNQDIKQQIVAHLVSKLNLPAMLTNGVLTIVGDVPDGEHWIPLGENLTRTRVVVTRNAIKIKARSAD